MLRQFSIEKGIIRNKDIPLTCYKYSYIRDRLKKECHQKVSFPTIIDRAKRYGFYLKKPKRTIHNRKVLAHLANRYFYPCQLIISYCIY